MYKRFDAKLMARKSIFKTKKNRNGLRCICSILTYIFRKGKYLQKTRIYVYKLDTILRKTVSYLIIHEGIIEILFSSNFLPWKMIKSGGIFDHLMANSILSMNV